MEHKPVGGIRNYREFVPQPGDIFVTVGSDSSVGHTGIVISSDDVQATVIDQNSTSDWNYVTGVPTWKHTITWTGIYSPTYYIRYKQFSFAPVQVSFRFEKWNERTYEHETDACVATYVYPNGVSVNDITQFGCDLFDLDGNWLAGKAETPYREGDHLKHYYPINDDPGNVDIVYRLTPATKYQYRYTVWVGDKKYYSDFYFFTTVDPCADGHKGPFREVTKTEPTCVLAGTMEKYCETCGKAAGTETIPALGHDWGDWVRTLEPTATTKGTEKRTCKRDASHIETRDIPPIAPSLSAVLSASASSIGKDGTFTVTVSLQNNPGIAAMTLSYALSGNTGTLEKAEAAGIASGAAVSASARISLMSAQDITGDGNILILTFKVNEVKDTTVTISCDKAANADQAIVTVSGASASAQAVKRIPGDANDDGFVDIVDAMMVLRYDSGWGVNINKSNSDVNGDGAVDIIDAMMILRYDSGWNVILV